MSTLVPEYWVLLCFQYSGTKLNHTCKHWYFIWLLLLLSLSKFNSIPSFLFLNHLVSFKIQNFHSSIFCDIILCNDFSKFVVTEDSLQDKLETICMTANTVVNQSVFHFFKEKTTPANSLQDYLY